MSDELKNMLTSHVYNEQALRTLIEQAYAHNLYFDDDRKAQKYCLVSPEKPA